MKALFAAAAVLLSSTTAFAQVADLEGRAIPDWDVALVAHRGLAPGLPENTLVAFENVIARGVGAIEIDLRGTLDGAVVIMHDSTVDRTTDGTGDVTSLTLAQIQALDAGSYKGPEFAGAPVPTYEEVLRLAQEHGVMLLLDIKLSDTLDREQIVRLTERYDAVLNVIVGVRSLSDLEAFRALNPNLRTLGFIATPADIGPFAEAGVNIIRLWPEWIRGEDRSAGDIPVECAGIDNCLIKQVRAYGQPVWTTAGEAPRAELIDLIEAGVNGILTDTPDVLADLLSDIDLMQSAN